MIFVSRPPFIWVLQFDLLRAALMLSASFFGSAITGFGADISLLRTVIPETGDVSYAVVGADDPSFSFLWSVDGKAISDVPIAAASALVLYANQQSPGSTFKVTVSHAGTATILSNTLSLTSALNTNADQTSAGMSTNGTASSNVSAGDTSSVSNSSSAPISTTTSASSAGGALINLSCRARIVPGKPLIAGLIVRGAQSKPVLIRALGPALQPYGVSGYLSNPVLTLYSGSSVIGRNDDWSGASVANATQTVGAAPLNVGSHDAALYNVLSPGGYTAHLDSGDSSTGIGLIEFYDAAPQDLDSAKLINISARGMAGTGDNVLIVGFVISGSANKQVLIRAVGPTLAQYGVTDSMPDPKLTLYSGSTIIAQNDNWSDTSDPATLANANAATGASVLPAASKDSALAISLAPGGYTAIVRTGSSDSSSGEVLIEVYEVP